MTTLPLTRSKHLLPFAALLRKRNEPVERLLRRANLPVRSLRDPELLIPVAGLSHFRELAARRLSLPNVSLAATEPLEIADLGAFGQALLTASTLQRSLSKFRDIVGTQSSNLTVELHTRPGGDLLFCHRELSEIGIGEWHRALYTLAWMIKIVRLVAPAWSPAEVWLDAKATPERFDAIESLGTVARFGHDCTGFLVPASMLALAPSGGPASDDRFNGRNQLTAPARSYAGALGQMLRSYASDGWLTIEAASEAANTSVRTMQRRLSAEQTTYSRVVEDTRANMAGDLLETTRATIAETAHQLGYKNQGDFTRAFRRWAGVSPSEFRRRRCRVGLS